MTATEGSTSVRSHAKATPAGSTLRGATGLGRIIRGAFATGGVSSGADGIGAPSQGRARHRTQRILGISSRTVILSIAVTALFAMALASSATAIPVPLGTFNTAPGAAALSSPRGLAVNLSGSNGTAGDVYVSDGGNNRIQEFSEDGNFVRAWGIGVVPGSAAGTATLTSVSGTSTLTAGSTTVNSVTGSFSVGQTISAAGIPAGTTITAVGVGTLTLSAAATASGSDVALIAGEVTSVVTTARAFIPGQIVTGAGIPTGTTITAVTTGIGSTSRLTLSNAVTANSTNVALTVSESPGNTPINESQTITVPPAATGSFNLKFKTTMPTQELETASIPVTATATEIGTALTGLANIGSGNVVVTEQSSGIFVVDFHGSSVSDTNVEQLKVSSTSGTVTVKTDVQGGLASEVCSTSCAIGTASASAGGLSSPWGIAIDQSTGNLYVSDEGNRRIDIFSPTGTFQGAFGWEVDQSNPEPKLQFCSTATGCQAAAAGPGAGQFGSLSDSTPAVDPSTHNLYVSDPGNLRLDEFSLSLSGDQVVGAAFVRAIGWKVNASTPLEQLQLCTSLTGCQKGTARNNSSSVFASQFLNQNPTAITVDSTGAIYAVNGKLTGNCSASQPCSILKFNSDGSFKESFGPDSGVCQMSYSSGSAVSQDPFDIAVSPTDPSRVFIAKKVSSSTFKVYEFDDEGGKGKPEGEKCAVAPTGTGLTGANLSVFTRGLAVGTDERLYATNGPIGNLGGLIYRFGPAPAPTVQMTEVTDVGSSVARFVGAVTPPAELEGQTFEAFWHFEYSVDGTTWTPEPENDKSAGSVPSVAVPVEREARGLAPCTKYQTRLIGKTGSVVSSDPITFTTACIAPSVRQLIANPIGQTTATLNAFIDPNRLPSTYHFEWATPEEWEADPGEYSHRLPVGFERHIGGGGEPVRVQEDIGSLERNAAYHFRVVTANAQGVEVGEDSEFLTLNECGLPEDRCFELVSPADKGPQGSVRQELLGNLTFQVAEDGQSALFPLLAMADTDSGGDSVFQATRTPSGWKSTKVSPPSLVPAPTNGPLGNASPGTVAFYSPDLSCGLIYTFNPLTADTPSADIELGTYNLYVRYRDGSHRLVTSAVPANPEIAGKDGTGIPATTVAGASRDCGRVFFSSKYKYLPGGSGLYEWDDGTLRDAGLLPDGSVPAVVAGQAVGAAPGGDVGTDQTRLNAVSPDGSRFFFSAVSDFPASNGKWGVFVREDGTVVEASRSQGGSADNLGASYETASADGSHVFFTANYGLTSASSSGPQQSCFNTQPTFGKTDACDLYDYDVNNGALTDLSATSDPENTRGAAVQGVIAVSDDGESVYFAARGQLVPDRGRTYAQNLAGGGSSNVYLSRGGQLHYVATISVKDQRTILTRASTIWSAEATPDGDHLLFESIADLTGYQSGGVQEAYLYSYSGGEGKIECLSCRLDGEPSVGKSESAGAATRPLIATFVAFPFKQYPTRKMSDDGSRAFFAAADALAPGAVADPEVLNLYEWRKGQVYFLATGPAPPESFVGGDSTQFYGISPSGDDVFLHTSQQLDAHDTDFVQDLYDARVGGGFPSPAEPPVSCDPAADQCQGVPTPAPGASSSATASFSGPGNPKATGGDDHCVRLARRANRFAQRARALRRKARRSRSAKVRRRARGAAKAAHRDSKAAKRCRSRARAANFDRGGAK